MYAKYLHSIETIIVKIAVVKAFRSQSPSGLHFVCFDIVKLGLFL